MRAILMIYLTGEGARNLIRGLARIVTFRSFNICTSHELTLFMENGVHGLILFMDYSE